jgi:hypothetical protein
MDVIDEQTKTPRLQIIAEPDNETDLMHVSKIKKLIGNDCMLRKTPKYEFKPLIKLNHIWFENEPNEFKLVGKNKIHKSRKTYEIKSNWVENFNELDEYRGAKNYLMNQQIF